MLPPEVKRRVFELVDSVQPESRYKVLIVDQRVKRLLDLVVEKRDLLNRQVANVLLLDESRPTENFLEAIYIVEQTQFSFECIQTDFTRIPHRYSAAHVFLLPKLMASESALQRFQQSAAGPFLRQVTPLPFSFLALEERVFSFGQIHANTVLYNQACKDIALEFVDLTARQLASLCETLKISPYIRYTTRWQVNRANWYPTLIANAAAKHIDQAKMKYMTPALETETRPTLLILDRTVDMTAPLRHELGFQAMALDVLDQQFQPRDTLREFQAPDGEPPQQLTESDKIWVELRHKHVVEVTEQLNDRLRELRATNPHLADPTSSTGVSVGDVRNMLAALPEFMKERESLALNLDIAQECMASVEKLHLKEIAEFEQTVTLGVASDGVVKPEVRLADALVTILAHKSVDRSMKIRALALYAVYRGGLRSADYEKLQHHAHLQDEDMATILGLSYLGIHMSYLGASVEKLPTPLTKEHKEQPLLFARVQTGLQTVLEQLVQGKLDSKEYPYAGEAPDSTQEVLSTATSLRNPRQRATWAQNVTSTPSPTSNNGTGNNEKGHKSKVRALAFIIGGITASETQAAYKVSETTGFPIYVGGHDMLTPSKFLEFLRTLNKSREELNLPEDQPERPVPEFLRASDRQNKQMQQSQQSKSQQPHSQQPQSHSQSQSHLKQQPRYPSPTSTTSSSTSASKSSKIPLIGRSSKQTPQLAPLATSQAASQPRGQAPITPTTYLNQPLNLETGSSQFASPAPPKEKKDMKHKLKGAFKLKK